MYSDGRESIPKSLVERLWIIFFLCIFKEKHFKKLFNTPMYALNAKEIHLNNALQNISINERFGITEIKRVWQSV